MEITDYPKLKQATLEGCIRCLTDAANGLDAARTSLGLPPDEILTGIDKAIGVLTQTAQKVSKEPLPKEFSVVDLVWGKFPDKIQSRSQARRAIAEGRVLLGDEVLSDPTQTFPSGKELRLEICRGK